MRAHLTLQRLLCGAASVALAFTATNALAQQGPVSQAASQPGGSTVVEEVVVSGSRVVRDGYSAPTPVSVVSADQIQATANENLGQYIIQLPALSGSTQPQTTASSAGAGGAGASSLNLRGLGTVRTLVLINGERTVGSLITGVVDVGTIPQQLISRVDVVTGGASAAYGSDALAGVVNFIIDNNFTGFKGEVSGGQTSYGDGKNWKLDLSGGVAFASDRGHLIASLEISDDNGQWESGRATGRDWLLGGEQVMNNPNYTATNGQPQRLNLTHVGPGNAYGGGLIVSGPLRGVAFGPGGAPFNWTFGDLVSGNQMHGGDWALTPRDRSFSLSPPQERQNIYTRANFDITPNLNVHGEVSFANVETSSNNSVQYSLGNLVIRSVNAFLPASMKAQLAAAGVTSFNMGSYYADLPPNDLFTKRRKLRIAGGFDGKFNMFDSPWTYDGYASVSWGMINNVVPHTTANLAMSMAMDSIIDPATGRAICNPANVGFTTGKVGVNLIKPPSACVPWNPFGIGVNNEAAVAWVMGSPNMYFHLKQDVAAINLRGEPFTTWAGPVSLAVGAEHRKESSDGTSDTISQNRAWFIGNYNPTIGSYSITEAYVETVVPLAANTSFADSLDLNAAFRAQDYSTSGIEYTWKLGLTYAPTPDLRLRATRSRDVREPTLLDLYAAGTTTTASLIDPFNNNLNAQYQATTVGNPNLTPERADTTGLGIVVQPRFLPGFGASIDYYRIDILDGINTIAPGTLVELCFSQKQYCDRIQRGPTPPPGGTVGAITQITSSPINFGAQKARGVDFEASYVMPLSNLWEPAPGTVTFRALATHYLTSVTDSGVPGSIPSEAVGGTGLPEWRYQARVGYRGDRWSGELAVRGISSGVLGTNFIECTSGCPTSTTNNPTININHYDAAHYFDFSLNYKFPFNGEENSAEAFFNVRNLLNTDPGIIPAGPGGVPDAVNSTSANLYDTMGRVYRVGLRVRM